MVCCSKTFTETYFVALQYVIFINKAQQPIIKEEIKEFTQTAVDFYAVVVISGFSISLDLGTRVIIPLDHSSGYI